MAVAKKMESTWRWYGPKDPITLADIKQTNATGIVTALHEVPNGEVWTVEAIMERKKMVEDAGMVWSVIESIPIHEDIKRRVGDYEKYFENYRQSLRNAAACGIDTVCYNFMPIIDWTRTSLRWPLGDGALALAFDYELMVAFDAYILARPGAENDYSEADLAAAKARFERLTDEEKEEVTRVVLAGLPGSEESYTTAEFQEALDAYAGFDGDKLRSHLLMFLDEIMPTAEEVGIRMAIHPDDPPRGLFGLPRVVSKKEDIQAMIDSQPSVANGITLCVGSYGSVPTNDVLEIAEAFKDRVYFFHARNVKLVGDDRNSFVEVEPFEGDADMFSIIKVLLEEQKRREEAGDTRLIPMRPDHGMQMLYDLDRVTNPGYSLLGRMKNLANLIGAEEAIIRGGLV